MQLHQIQVTYEQNDDRILVRATFTRDNAPPLEFRAWFTRHFVKFLWPGITATLQAQVVMNQPQVAHASVEIVNMGNQAARASIRETAQENAALAASTPIYPLGEAPILVNDVQFTLVANQPVRMHFTDAKKNGLEMHVTPAILHSFCALLQQAVTAADWGMELHLPGAAGADDTPRVLN